MQWPLLCVSRELDWGQGIASVAGGHSGIVVKSFMSHKKGMAEDDNDKQSFFAEATRLLYIERHKPYCGVCGAHMPAVLRVDVANRTIWQEFRGVDLKEPRGIREVRALKNFSAQLGCIDSCLARMELRHCDPKPKNFAVLNGLVSIIDFDLALSKLEMESMPEANRTWPDKCASNVTDVILGHSAMAALKLNSKLRDYNARFAALRGPRMHVLR